MSHETKHLVQRIKHKISHAEHHVHDKLSTSDKALRLRRHFTRRHERSTAVRRRADGHPTSRNDRNSSVVTCETTSELILTDTSAEISITKIDVEEITARSTRVITNGTQNILREPKYVRRRQESQRPTWNGHIGKSPMLLGVIAVFLGLWGSIFAYLGGLIVGGIAASALLYQMIKSRFSATSVEEWLEFPQLEQMRERVVIEDQSTRLEETNLHLVFGRYDADNDEDFLRYPVVVQSDNQRLIFRLSTSRTNHRWIGYREYSLKEANLMLVPEATLTRSKYWLVEYPIVIHNVQILDKQMIDSTNLDLDSFFNNPTTTLSLFFETAPQKEHCFHKLASIIRKGATQSDEHNRLLSSFVDRPSASELHSDPIEETDELDLTVPLSDHSECEETEDELDLTEPSHPVGSQSEYDSTGTKRTAASVPSPQPDETTLDHVLNSVGCLDATAVTINLLLRRLLDDLFVSSFFADLLKQKLEIKFKEISAVAIFDDLKISNVDFGNTYPVVLKSEPMKWNSRGIWMNLFLYYHGSIKLRVRTQLQLEKLLNRNREQGEPMFKQHHSAQKIHKREDKVTENDLLTRHKILATEPEVAEIVPARKLGTVLQNLTENRYLQMIAGWTPIANLLNRLSHTDTGADIEVTDFFGALTLNIPPPPSDRLWVGFAEVPNLKIKVSPFFNQSSTSNPLLQDFLAATIRAQLKRMVVLPSMDDQLLPLCRDWALDVIGQIAARSGDHRIKHLDKDYRQNLRQHYASVEQRHVNEPTRSETLNEQVTQL